MSREREHEIEKLRVVIATEAEQNGFSNWRSMAEAVFEYINKQKSLPPADSGKEKAWEGNGIGGKCATCGHSKGRHDASWHNCRQCDCKKYIKPTPQPVEPEKNKWAYSEVMCRDCKIVSEANAFDVCGNCMRIIKLLHPPAPVLELNKKIDTYLSNRMGFPEGKFHIEAEYIVKNFLQQSQKEK